MSTSTVEELHASIRSLEAELPTAPPEMRSILLTQIDSLKQTIAMFQAAAPHMEAAKAHRPQVAPHLVEWFRPIPAVSVPAWIPDGIHRSQVDASMMRAPPGARVYEDARGISCAYPGEKGVSLAVVNGLALSFDAEGRLQWQTFYENGCARWSIGYHSNGQRASVGFYASTEPHEFIEHGLHTRYAFDGTVVAQAEYVNGRLHGWQKLWEEDGYPIVGTHYVDGREVESVRPDGSANKQ